MSKIVDKILKTEVDHEPTGGYCLARIIRLEKVVEKLSKQKLDDILEPPAEPAPAAPAATPPAAPPAAPANAS